MKKLITILIIITVLLSGCISKADNKYDGNKTGSNKDEYASYDDTTEEDDSSTIQVEYNNLDLNNK